MSGDAPLGEKGDGGGGAGCVQVLPAIPLVTARLLVFIVTIILRLLGLRATAERRRGWGMYQLIKCYSVCCSHQDYAVFLK